MNSADYHRIDAYLSTLGYRLVEPLDTVLIARRIVIDQAADCSLPRYTALCSLNWLRWLATVAKEMEVPTK